MKMCKVYTLCKVDTYVWNEGDCYTPLIWPWLFTVDLKIVALIMQNLSKYYVCFFNKPFRQNSFYISNVIAIDWIEVH